MSWTITGRRCNQAYLLVSVAHKATIPNYVGSQNEAFSYENRYEGIPLTVPYRPPRVTRKPVVAGSQTAVVVGTSGEEIYVDKYGRGERYNFSGIGMARKTRTAPAGFASRKSGLGRIGAGLRCRVLARRSSSIFWKAIRIDR